MPFLKNEYTKIFWGPFYEESLPTALTWAEEAFCRDIPSQENKPDPGDKNSLGYLEDKKIPNPGDFV